MTPAAQPLSKLVVALLAQLWLITAQTQQEAVAPAASSAVCSAGQIGLARSIDTISPQELVEGVLESSKLTAWDFKDRAGVLAALTGSTVSLSCAIIGNVTVSLPAEQVAFLQPTAIDLTGAAGLTMRNVWLETDCASVLSYQQYFCSTHRVAGSLQLERGAVHFTQWDDGFTELQNVTLTCPSPDSAPQPPCRLAAVRTAQQLLEAFTGYAAASSSNVTIVVADNISIPTSGFWPAAPVPVNAHVTMLGSPLLGRPVLDMGLNVKMWALQRPWTFALINLTAVNLAPSYYTPGIIFSQFGMLSERVWAFQRYERLLYVINCTLVVPPEQLAYTTYWLTFLVSPVPDAQAKAAWIRILGMKVAAVNESGVYYESAVAWTVFYDNVRITDSLAGAAPLLRQDTGLWQLLAESVPLTSCNPANSTADLRLALLPNNSSPDGSDRRWVLLVANVSVTEADAQAAGLGSAAVSAAGTGNSSASGNGSGSAEGATLTLPGSVIFSRGPGLLAYRLSFAGRAGSVVVPAGSTLTFRHLILSGLAGRSASYSASSPLAALGGPLWGLDLSSGASKVRLENCTVLLSADELRLLQQCVLPSEAAAALPGGRSYDDGLLAAATQFYTAADTPQPTAWGPGYLYVDSGATQRYVMYGVTFRTPVAADGEDAAANFTALGVPYASGGGGGSDGLEPWAIGVIVGCIVGGVLLLALTALALLLRHRRLGTGVAGGAGTPGKAVHGDEEATAGRLPAAPPPSAGSAGMSPFLTASQELTSSSKVLRPGARASGAGHAAGAGAVSLPLKLASGSTESGVVGAAELAIMLAGAGSDANLMASVGSAPAASAGGGRGSGAAVSYSAVTAAGAAAAVSRLMAAPADSFDVPPTSSMLGQHGVAGSGTQTAAGSSRSMCSGQATGTGTGTGLSQQLASRTAAGSGARTPDEGAGSAVGARSSQAAGASSPVPASATAYNSTAGGGGGGGGSAGSGVALEQLHAMIHILGRDFNDRQLEVHGLLGKGAYGTVYKGKWRGLPVAVKSMVCNSESSVRQQHRPLMEAAISSNLVHPNIVTTYSYELREVEHELASLSPELARQGGGWRLLIIQEYCDAGPLRRIIDCGFFHTPPHKTFQHEASQTPAAGRALPPPPGDNMRGGLSSSAGRGEGGGGNGAETAVTAQGVAAPGDSDAAAASSSDAAQTTSPAEQAGPPASQPNRRLVVDVPADVPGRPGSALEAALRYVEAALMIARGLQHIHDKNIVHGDLNPNNVLLMRAPGSPLGFCLKVADFGLSVRMAEGESHMSNLFQGSPYYCAPEVVLSGKIGKSADIYSLGIMLWELQHGVRPPWRMGVRLRTFPSLNTGELEFGPDTPPRYARLARDCFHGSKDARPAIAAVVDSLAAIKQDLEAIHGP